MPNIRSCFTYLWLLIVACCVVTKPVVAAPITAQVITIKCRIDGDVVEKQILLIGVKHDGADHDAKCFRQLRNIIDRFIEQHKGKNMSPIPVLLEALGYQGIHKNVFPVEFKLASKYLNATDTSPFCFIQADERGVNKEFLLGRWLDAIFEDSRLDKRKRCGPFKFYQELQRKLFQRLIQSLDDLQGLGLPVQKQVLECEKTNWEEGVPDSSSSSFFTLCYRINLFRRLLSLCHEPHPDTTDICDSLMNLPADEQKDCWKIAHLFVKQQMADACFFSQLVKRLADNDKIILFCGSMHIDNGKGDGLVTLFRDFGCTVEDIELCPILPGNRTDQKYISAFRVQEIFTNFLSCCNSCGKTKACLKDNEKMKFCAQCHAVMYCSRKCQITDWKKHKELSPGCVKKKKK